MKIKLDAGAFMPLRAHETDAGLDLRSPFDCVVPARGSAVIDTGVHVQLPLGTAGMLKSKSGLNVKHGITSEGVIDVGIKLVEDVVEEQDGALVEYAGIAEEECLTELEGQQESLLLPLAAYTLDRVVAERHLEFVLVDALGCPT